MMTTNVATDWHPSNEDVAYYDQNGFWKSPKLFDDQFLKKCIERMGDLYHGKYETGIPPAGPHWKYGDSLEKLRKSDNVHVSDSYFYKLSTNEKLGEIAAAFLRTKQVRLLYTQMLYKPPRGNQTNQGNVGWHQDLQYWYFTERPTLVTAWVALDDVTVDNGCMQMVPESHKWGLLNEGDFYEGDLEQQAKLIKDKKAFNPVHVELKAGQASFHHALTYHGSGRNVSDSPRLGIAIHLMAGETLYRSGDKGWDENPYLPSFRKLKTGDVIVGDEFPIIYEA
jgi:hypothetical protein